MLVLYDVFVNIFSDRILSYLFLGRDRRFPLGAILDELFKIYLDLCFFSWFCQNSFVNI